MGDVKILVVDDEPRMRKLVKDFLVKDGFIVLEAEDGEDAYNKFISSNDISLIIMDVSCLQIRRNRRERRFDFM